MKIEDGLKRFTVGATMLAIAGSAAGTGCPPVADSVWRAGMMAMSLTINAGITSLVESVGSAHVVNMMRIQSAIRVVTKQIETSSEKTAATETAAKQAGANFMAELSNRKAILETTMEYNAATGQGFDPCGEQRRSQNIAVAIGEANNSMGERVLREIDAAPGKLAANPAAIVSKRLSEARSLYCTPDQAAVGLCPQAGAMAGKDADASNFFASYAVGSPEAQAKSAMLNHLYGVPYMVQDKSVANSPTGKAFLEAKRTEDAFRSVSQASMKSLQSWTEPRSGGGAASDSVLNSISAKVGTYAGGNNYAAWEQKKASESERGLLVDLAKMRAFDMYMRHLEYQQYERMEANLAALLAMRSRGQDGSTAERAASRAKVN